MELHVKRDELGAFMSADILNLTTEDYVVIHKSLESCLSSEKKALEYFQNTTGILSEDKKEKVLTIVKNDMHRLEKLIKVFEEPVTTRVSTK